MAGLAALLAAAAVVQAAPKPKTEDAAAAPKAKTSADKKRRSAKKAADGKPASKKADKKSDKSAAAKKSAAKSSTKSSAKSAQKTAVPLPQRRPADSATVTGAFPTPIGTAPILPSGLVAAPSAVAAPQFAAPQREASLTPPTSHVPSALVPATPISADSLAAVKKAVELTRRRRNSEATAVAGTVTDPVAAKLIEWLVLRAENDEFDFQRYAGFATENPTWPNINQFRRKAEAALFQNGVNDTVIRRYFATTKPLTAKGTARLRARLADTRRPRSGAATRARDLAHRCPDGRYGTASARHLRRAALRRRPQGADGPAPLRRRQRRGATCGATARRIAGRDRQSPCRGLGQIVENQGFV